MRNFKKFLALVLAMLMVSACAVSVSAAYADQAAIDATGYADAVAVLSDLGVIKGDGENFRPEGTLRRDEAAVIAAKLYAGVAGQSYDWTAATTSFVDVDAAWSFAYINYVAQRGIMDGIGDSKFAPTATLSLAQALTIAVKVAGLQSEVAELAKVETPAYWATHWIAVAGEYGFDKGINIWDYDAACTRAQMAQIAYNVLNYENDGEYPFIEKFDLVVAETKIESVGDAVVLANGATANLAAFNAKLTAAGFEGTAADYVDHNVTITYAKDANVIYSVDVTTVSKEMAYTDALIANVKDKDGNLTTEITIEGVTYTVAATAGSDTSVNAGIGSGTSVTNSIVVDGFAAGAAVPTYYKAVAYEDNGDGKYDRLDVNTYDIAVLVKEAEVDHDGDDKTAKVNPTTVNYVGEKADVTITPATFSGVATTWGEAPVLVYVEGSNIDVLELAEKVTGVVTNIKAGTYITIDKAYNFAEAFVAPEAWVLGQNVTIYTINGKYVAVASADTGVESGMVEKTVRVDNVVVENGNAIVTGYLGNSFETVTLKVVGIVSDAGKLVAKSSYEIANKVTIDGTEKTFAGQIEVADKDKDGKTTTQYVAFADDASYTFAVTSAGAYYKAEATALDYATKDLAKVEVKNGYIYIDGTAQYKMASSYTVVTEAPKYGIENNYNFYADTYVVTANSAVKADTATLGFFDANNAVVSAGQVDKTVSLIYVVTSATAAEVKVVNSLAANETIVQIVSVESESLDYTTYNAIDLFTGAKVTVTGSAALKEFYVAAEGKVVEAANWMGYHNLEITTVLDMQTIKACNTKLVGDDKVLTADGDAVAFGVDAIKAYKLADGIIDLENAGVVADALAETVYGYIDNGQMIILYTPAA